MDGKNLIAAFTPATLMQGARSTVLNSLGWMAALLVSAISLGSYTNTREWILILFAVGLALDFLLFLAAFIYFGLKDKDALRSERFGIQKLQLEKGVLGDSESGFGKQIEGEATSNPNLKIEER